MQNILTFSNQKSLSQAVIFYLFWTIVPFALLVLVDVVFFSLIPINYRYIFGRVIASVLPAFIGFTMYSQKKLNKEVINIIAVFLALIMGWVAGIFVGMLPILYLSTLKKSK